jgi:predicted alpha/beta hydrolase
VENVALCVSRRGSEGVGSHPFVLVGHSFGGLVIKALINETKRRSHSAETNALDTKAIRKAKDFLQNLKGIVFYAVPHSGADAATLLSYFKFVGLSKIIGNLTPFSRRMEKMSVTMKDTLYNKGINIYAFGEGKPTYLNTVCTKSKFLLKNQKILVGFHHQK